MMIDVDRPADGVALVTIERAEKKNALSIALRREANAALATLGADETVRALVVTGAGSAFSAGFDLDEFAAAFDDAALADELWATSDEWHRRWLTFPVPTVAAVNGPALGGGFDLAVLCDLRVGCETAVFAHPEIRFGDVVYGPLHDLVGGAVARDLCFTGRRVEADEALRLGLLTRIVRSDELVASAIATAEGIAQASRDVLVRTKAKALRAGSTVVGATLEL